MTSDLTIVSGNVQDAEVFRVIAFIDQLREKRSTASGIYKYTCNDKKWTIFNLDWAAIDLCLMKNQGITLAILSESGVAMLVNKDGYKTIEIAPGLSGPGGFGPLRALCGIDSSAFAVGMGRQVYKIESDGSWLVHETGITRPKDIGDVCGFNSIHGINKDLLCAVGFNGEIWVCKAGNWAQVESPTNVVLHNVRISSSQKVFVGGQKGTLLVGNGDVFSIVDTEIDIDIWGMDIFKDKLYFCTEKALYTLNDEVVEKVDVAIEHDTLRSVHSRDGMICVFGPKNILKSNDGIQWESIYL